MSATAQALSLACLLECGLFDLMPELDNEFYKHRLFLRVRETIVSAANPLSSMTCRIALQVASSFGEEWNMVMMIAFLALRGRPQGYAELLPLIRGSAGKIS